MGLRNNIKTFKKKIMCFSVFGHFQHFQLSGIVFTVFHNIPRWKKDTFASKVCNFLLTASPWIAIVPKNNSENGKKPYFPHIFHVFHKFARRKINAFAAKSWNISWPKPYQSLSPLGNLMCLNFSYVPKFFLTMTHEIWQVHLLLPSSGRS